VTRRAAAAIALVAALVAWSCGSGEPTEAADETTTSGAVVTTATGSGAAGSSTTADTGAGATTSSCDSTTEAPSTTQPSTTPPSETTSPSTAPPSSTTVDPLVGGLQQALTDLGYWLGPVDGLWGSSSAHAAVAFQKVSGLEPTGVADRSLADALAAAARPEARDPSRPGLEIDLGRQVAMLVVDGAVRWVLDVSSGTPATPTPTGEFTVTREIDGNRVSPLGVLYRPKYFTGGYAVHGYPSVPPDPASHGCVRVTFAAMDLLWAEGHLPVGARVTVYG